MQAILLWIAAGIGAAWFAVHLLVGGRQVAAPLRASDLPELVRATAWLCWHLTSATLAAMPVLFALAASGGPDGLALAATLIAAAFAATGLAVPILLRVPFATVPQGALFVPVAALGVWALLL